MPSTVSETQTGGEHHNEISHNEQNQMQIDLNESESEKLADADENSMSLPLSKIKKIFKIDPEYSGSSASAVYATGAATELFVQYLVEQASMNAKVDKRKKVQYRDVSSAVSTQESLYFLSDTVPKTQAVKDAMREKRINISNEDRETYSSLLEDKDKQKSTIEEPAEPGPFSESTKQTRLANGQTTLPFETVPQTKKKKPGLSDLMADNEDSESSDVVKNN